MDIKLLQDGITVSSKPCVAGDIVTVSKPSAERLIKLGLGEAISKPNSKLKKK